MSMKPISDPTSGSTRPQKMKGMMIPAGGAQANTKNFSSKAGQPDDSAQKYQEFFLNPDSFKFVKVLPNSTLGTVRVVSKIDGSKKEKNILYVIREIESAENNTEESKQFLRELELYIKVKSHPGLSKFYGYYIMPKRAIVTEYYENGSLRDLFEKLDRNERVPEWTNDLKAKIIFGVACTMMHIHSNKAIHRDLRPSNILFDKNWEPHITDFVYSKTGVKPNEELISRVGPSYFYHAPEVLITDDGKNHYNKKVDIYSFAILAYCVVTNGERMLKSLVSKEVDFVPVILSNKRPPLPDDLNPLIKGIITKSWDSDPSKRPIFSQIVKALINLDTPFPDIDLTSYISFRDKYFNDATIAPEDKALFQRKKVENGKSPKPPNKLKAKSSQQRIVQSNIEDMICEDFEGDEEFRDALETAQRGSDLSPAACVRVGQMLYKGNGCRQDQYSAYLFFKKAAESGFVIGLYNCAMCKIRGIGTPVDKKGAMEMLKLAADPEKRAPMAINAYGEILEQDGQIDQAMYYYKISQKLGSNQAIYNYGRMAEKKGNIEKALHSYQRAASNGDELAANDYAVLLLSSESKDNISKALTMLKQTASREFGSANYNLGKIYWDGSYGQRRDHEIAVEYFKEAARKHHVNGCFYYAFALSHGDGIKKDIDEALKYFKEAADNNHTIAMVQMARILQNDKREFEEAAKYLKKASDLGDATAQMRYAECFEKGTGVKKNLDIAIRYYEMSAKQGKKEAENKLKELKNNDDDDDDDDSDF
ncbi:hypothetical protein TRFO_35647 [Tritrichomonas foetus]|uniref:Protein kinase domain-containing protein n=1 Tax=Tritrichomonas foetus TaxID=1144522 RepID=A0A1J4JKD6_9EUKA|nr:hypothetical protein TRFO_35647 [Tritrichomonas foetus]|eukprot:OHS98037.1 hypothetical protein TRFO_35647 [Tritrichomonas foetus]